MDYGLKANLHIEALIFAADQPVRPEEIRQCLAEALGMELSPEEIQERLLQLKTKYHSDDYAFELMEISGGYHFMTKPDYYPTLSIFLKERLNKKLSAAALETLAIIAYKQPVSKTDIEQIRGVNSDYTVQKLLEKDLIAIAGKSSAPGRPLLYATSESFMNYFGINSLDELPRLKDIQPQNENEIGITEE